MPAEAPRYGKNCYGHCREVETRKNDEEFSQHLFNIGHVSVFSIPKSRRVFVYLYMALAFLAWAVFLPRGTQLRALACSLIYTGIEYSFTWWDSNTPFTSMPQFLANVLYLPLAIDLYSKYLYDTPVMFVLLFPLNCWILEIAETLMFVYPWHGRNVAWCYCYKSTSGFGGVIRVIHGVYWILMGAAALVVFPSLLEATGGKWLA